MKIKFKNLKMFYLLGTIIAPICVLIQIFEPDIEEYSKIAQFISLTTIIIMGIFGALSAVLEKSKVIDIIYSEEDKKSIFYKITKFSEDLNK